MDDKKWLILGGIGVVAYILWNQRKQIEALVLREGGSLKRQPTQPGEVTIQKGGVRATVPVNKLTTWLWRGFKVVVAATQKDAKDTQAQVENFEQGFDPLLTTTPPLLFD